MSEETLSSSSGKEKTTLRKSFQINTVFSSFFKMGAKFCNFLFAFLASEGVLSPWKSLLLRETSL